MREPSSGVVSITLSIESAARIVTVVALLALDAWAVTRLGGKQPVDASADQGTLGLLKLTVGMGLMVGFIASQLLPELRLFESSTAPVVAGLVTAWLGLVVRVWSIVHLGRLFVAVVAIQDEHRLITDGVYRFLRHPAYTGLLLMCGGIGLSFNNMLSLLVLTVPLFIALLKRIDLEENALEATFGDAYERYKRRSRRLLPWVW